MPSEDDFVKSEINGFGDTIGSITNRATSMISMRDGFDPVSDEFAVLSYRISTMILYQQNAIDRIKGIISKPIPHRWISCKDNDDEFGKTIAAEQKPYFFIYRYAALKSQYDKYVKQAEANCHRRFGASINQMDKQSEFIQNYYRYMPVNLSPGTMNRICWKIENEFAPSNKISNSDFDYSILKTDAPYDQEEFDAVYDLYLEYTRTLQVILKNVEANDSCDRDSNSQISNLIQIFSEGCVGICPDQNKLANILIDVCYTTEKSKGFAWEIAGEQIFLNVFAKTGMMQFPVLDEDGDIEYNGKRYAIKTIARDSYDIKREEVCEGCSTRED